MHAEPEVQLVRSVQKGDVQAHEELVDTFLPLVFNLVGRSLNDGPETENIVQDTWLRAMIGLGGLRSGENFRPWLAAIAVNGVEAYWQTQRDRGEYRSDATGFAGSRTDVVLDFADLTVAHLNLSDQHLELVEASRWLKPSDKLVLSLWWLECTGELTRAEIAQALDASAQRTAFYIDRMKEHLESARVVERALHAAPSCPLLEEALGAWNGERSSLWGKRILRHAQSCPGCLQDPLRLYSPEPLLLGLPLVPPSASLVKATLEVTSQVVAPLQQTPPEEPRRVRRRKQRQRGRRRAAVAVAVAALVATGVALYVSTRSDAPASDAADKDGPRSALHIASPAASTTGTPSAGPSKSVSEKASRSASPSKPPTPRRPLTTARSAEAAKTPPRPAASSPAQAPADTGTSGEESQVISLVNKERAAAGCGALTSNSLLATAAKNHSDDMAQRGFFEHVNPDGKDPGDRITAAGYKWSTYGENIALGQKTAAAVMDAWMNSPGHRANILNCSFKEIGVGVHTGAGGPWWTQDFGAR
ncbi:sigma-70 family RNA polymerase sigma factor [Streptomyces sp. NPDC005529]|uniref:sigma-70 family RNA polymerase sigma factor n=1 Tax=unclassified Streptomyces TaxID=2593676 RepID=UPI0033A45632